VVAIEFALIFVFGLLPLLMLTLSGVLIFAARQSLTLAAAEGARASLHFGSPEQRGMYACTAAKRSMQWLLDFSGNTATCTSGGLAGAITVDSPAACPSTPDMTCVTVHTSFNHDDHPFIPGTTSLYHWLMHGPIHSSATMQLDTQGS